MTTHQAGPWIKARMKKHKWTVKYLTDRSGVSRQTIYDAQKDLYPMSDETQRKLAGALEVKPDWYERLMTGRQPLELPNRPSSEPPDRLSQRVARVETQIAALGPWVALLRDLTPPAFDLMFETAERAGVEVPPELRTAFANYLATVADMPDVPLDYPAADPPTDHPRGRRSA